MKKVFLFDLDGVIFNTESQYSTFWKEIGEEYLPEVPGIENKIKGQTLNQIFEAYFQDKENARLSVVDKLNQLEKSMRYEYIAGFVPFVERIRAKGMKTAVVTSSNSVKMEQVYRQHPTFKALFDRIFTSEDVTESKPHPQCYLLGADYFNCSPEECVGFEDSVNGLKAVRAAGMTVVGLSTTNPIDVVAPLADLVIPCYRGLEFEDMLKLVL